MVTSQTSTADSAIIDHGHKTETTFSDQLIKSKRLNFSTNGFLECFRIISHHDNYHQKLEGN